MYHKAPSLVTLDLCGRAGDSLGEHSETALGPVFHRFISHLQPTTMKD